MFHVDEIKFENCTLTQLRQFAKQIPIKGYSTLKKPDIISMLREYPPITLVLGTNKSQHKTLLYS